MECKMFEIRDRATFIPVLAVRMKPNESEAERYLLDRGGYKGTYEQPPMLPYVFVVKLTNSAAVSDENAQENRTMYEAHKAIQENWDDLPTGSVIDVEFIRGETEQPKRSERFFGQNAAPGEWGVIGEDHWPPDAKAKPSLPSNAEPVRTRVYPDGHESPPGPLDTL